MAEFLIRPGKADDYAFARDAWVKQNRSSAFARDAGACYETEHTRLVRRLLRWSTLRVAHAPDDVDAILGFACFDLELQTPALHYVYVRKEDRGKGIAHALLEPLNGRAKVRYSHKPVMPRSDAKLPANWYYDSLYSLINPPAGVAA